MDKSKLKTNYDPIRRALIKKMAEETGFSYQFIADAAAGRRTTENAQRLRREYNERYAEINEALKSN